MQASDFESKAVHRKMRLFDVDSDLNSKHLKSTPYAIFYLLEIAVVLFERSGHVPVFRLSSLDV